MLGYSLFALFRNEWSCYACAVIVGIGNGHMFPAFNNMFVNLATPSQRGTANATLLTSWDIGMGLGMLGGGVVAEYLGYDAAFWGVVAVNAAGVLTYFLATKSFFLRRNLNQSVR